MSGESCHFCDGTTFKLIHLDYYTATGRKRYPSINSKSYDDRYGFWYHESCLTPAQRARLLKKEKVDEQEAKRR